jgi:CRP-like cAMP-binding protein
MADQQVDWLAVIGRSLAQFSLDAGPARDKNLAEKAKFLEALGLPRNDVAEMLGTTYASISELLRQAKNKKGAKKNAIQKKRK